jgi:hypothetical protein
VAASARSLSARSPFQRASRFTSRGDSSPRRARPGSDARFQADAAIGDARRRNLSAPISPTACLRPDLDRMSADGWRRGGVLRAAAWRATGHSPAGFLGPAAVGADRSGRVVGPRNDTVLRLLSSSDASSDVAPRLLTADPAEPPHVGRRDLSFRARHERGIYSPGLVARSARTLSTPRFECSRQNPARSRAATSLRRGGRPGSQASA